MTIKRLTKKGFLAAIAAASLTIASVAEITVHAYRESYHRASDGSGNNYYLSCGSSAGDFFYKCDASGNCTDLGSAGASQACADMQQ